MLAVEARRPTDRRSLAPTAASTSPPNRSIPIPAEEIQIRELSIVGTWLGGVWAVPRGQVGMGSEQENR